MGEYEQISLVPDLGGEIEEEDRIRKREEENLVESLLFSLGRTALSLRRKGCGKDMRRGRKGFSLKSWKIAIRW